MPQVKPFCERAAVAGACIEYEPLYNDNLLVDDHREPRIPFAVNIRASFRMQSAWSYDSMHGFSSLPIELQRYILSSSSVNDP